MEHEADNPPPIEIRIAQIISPEAWNPPLRQRGIIRMNRDKSISLAKAIEITSILKKSGCLAYEPKILKEAVDNAVNLTDLAVKGLKAFEIEARGDLKAPIALLNEACETIAYLKDEILCDACGEYSADGEGFDGLCGSCADQASDEDGEALDVAPDHNERVDIDPDNASWTYSAVFHDDEALWRGLWSEEGEPMRSTPLLYPTALDARIAARQLSAAFLAAGVV